MTFLDTFLFTKHVSIMLKSGITIVEALDILDKQTKSSAFKKVIEQIAGDIRNGNALSKALTKHPKVFDSLYVSLIEVGEQSGKLDENLQYLANQLQKEYAFRQKVKGALMYPAIVFIAAITIGIGISLFVLPQLIDLFKDLDVTLPLTTQLLLGFAALMRDYGILIFIGFIASVIGIKLFSQSKTGKPLFDRLILSLPLFGSIARNAQLALLCRSLGIMIKSGLPITTALEIEVKLNTNTVFQQYTQELLTAVTKGKSLSFELDHGNYTQIPLLAAKMIAVGEETGHLDETLLYLGDFFEDAVDDATKNISTTLEPVMLLFIGVVVAFISFSIISPIYSLSSSIKR